MANRIFVEAQDIEVPQNLCKNAERFLNVVMERQSYDGEELSVTFCGDSFIQELNSQYRNIDAPTDVLSFENGSSYEDEEGQVWSVMGDIIISMETLKKNADYFEVSQNEELKRLLVHGLLHLHGMDHGEEHVEKGKKPECEMLCIQEEILSAMDAEKIIG